MKILKSYNESLRDKMIPKPDEDILSGLKKLNPLDRINKINIYRLGKKFYPSVDEILKASEQMTPQDKLNIGCKNGIIELVKIAIEEGVDINNSKSLVNACLYGHFDVAKYLIENGADVNRTNDKHSPLTLSASYGYFDIVKLLVENGADLFYQDPLFRNALACAASKLHYNIVDYLLNIMKTKKE